jgi:hypothetical protein
MVAVEWFMDTDRRSGSVWWCAHSNSNTYADTYAYTYSHADSYADTRRGVCE